MPTKTRTHGPGARALWIVSKTQLNPNPRQNWQQECHTFASKLATQDTFFEDKPNSALAKMSNIHHLTQKKADFCPKNGAYKGGFGQISEQTGPKVTQSEQKWPKTGRLFTPNPWPTISKKLDRVARWKMQNGAQNGRSFWGPNYPDGQIVCASVDLCPAASWPVRYVTMSVLDTHKRTD